MAISSVAGFESPDIFLNIMRFLNAKDVFLVERVCQSWQKAVSDLFVWERLFEAENIPTIVGRRPDYKVYVTLRGMFERGVGVEAIRKFYGEPVFGKMPQISPEKYDLMFKPDPEDPAKMMFETYEAIFTPLAIKRTFVDLVATVDEEGRVKIAPQSMGSCSEGYEMEIPFSFPNLVELSKYPLAGQENGPVFGEVNVQVLEQCHTCATKAGIYFMRSNILERSRNETWVQQEARAKSLTQEIVPLVVRAFSNSTKILGTKNCPDRQTPEIWTYSRTADRVQIRDDSCHPILGGFAPDGGVSVGVGSGNRRVGDHRDAVAGDYWGAAPGVPAEA